MGGVADVEARRPGGGVAAICSQAAITRRRGSARLGSNAATARQVRTLVVFVLLVEVVLGVVDVVFVRRNAADLLVRIRRAAARRLLGCVAGLDLPCVAPLKLVNTRCPRLRGLACEASKAGAVILGDVSGSHAQSSNTPDTEQAAAAFGVGKIVRHLFVCLGPDCTDLEAGEATWTYMKRRMKDLNLAGRRRPVLSHQVPVPAHLHGGPICVVYPEGAWYRDVTPENAERIIQQHLINGRIVEDLCFARNPLWAAERVARHSGIPHALQSG